MNTDQNYTAQADRATNLELSAKKPNQTAIQSADSEINLLVSAWQQKDNPSEASLVYWALEGLKRNYQNDLAGLTQNDEEFEKADYCQNKLQELQNNLFDSVAILASNLSLSANGMSHE